MRKLIAFAFAALLCCQTALATAADLRTLGNSTMACMTMRDWIDVLSLNRQDGAAAAALAERLDAGECTRWLKGVQVRVEQRETGKLASGEDIRLACAKPTDRGDTKCSWVIDDASLGRPQ